MSIVVEMRECRIWPCTDLGSAPACTNQVACEVRKQRQFARRPSFFAAGLMNRFRMLPSRIGFPVHTDWKTKSSGPSALTTL